MAINKNKMNYIFVSIKTTINKMITEYFYSQGVMATFVSNHGVTKDNIFFMGKSGDRWQLSYWIN